MQTEQQNSHQKHDGPLAVAVITPAGTFPDEDDYRRAEPDERISTILELAGKKLELTNTSDWVANVGDRQLQTSQTFREAGLHCVVDIEWHKAEGGGGGA